MWKRSEVEQLTGLGRHTIQDLCNQNTSRDGLGFWEPAVMKPGHSRFDEGDLLAFYMVRQLIGVGFKPAEVGPVILSMTEKDEEFVDAFRRRAHALQDLRATIDEQLAGLERLEEAAQSCSPDNRLYAVMGSELRASADRSAHHAVIELHAPSDLHERVRVRLREIVDSLTESIRGEGRGLGLDDLEACLVCPGGWGATDEQVLLAHALSLFLDESEDGVPVELALGKGSFVRLRQLADTSRRNAKQ